MKTLTLTGRMNGKNRQKVGEARIDEEFYEELSKHTWSYNSGGITTELRENGEYKRVQLHHYIWTLAGRTVPTRPNGLSRKDKDPLNNLLGNLEILNPIQLRLKEGLRSSNTTGYKGVSYCQRTKNYKAGIGHDKKNYHLGFFPTPEEAYAAYKAKHLELFGAPPFEAPKSNPVVNPNQEVEVPVEGSQPRLGE